MAGVRNIRNKKRYKNYISALVALNKTGESLETFTENGLQVVHQQITQRIGNMQVCTHQCSSVLRDFNRWCHTCLQWKTELEKWLPHGTARGINWSRLHSWTWSINARAITEVFIIPGWDTNNINLKDLSAILMIWHRCSRFSRQLVALSDHVRDDRNELAHNHTMSITTRRKTAIFQNIRNVINHQDVQQSILNLPDVLQALQELEQGDLFHYENALQVIAEQYENINKKIDRLALGLAEQRNAMHDLAKKVTIFTIVFVTIVLLIFIVCLKLQPRCDLIYSNPEIYLASQHHRLPRISTNSSIEGCLSESTVLVPLGNVSLFAYLSHHKIFIGRKWLYQIVRQELFNKDRHGLLLEAGMGYGKSALMAHIICANNGSIYSEIRKQLVAFHVCRFDVSVSKQVSTFAFRLLEMISRQITELIDTITACQQLFDRASCEEDPNGCLDHCVIVPLNKIHFTKEKPLVIALDALDECHDPYRNENRIFLLLKHRINWFPHWIKFFITSRFDSDIQQLVKDLMFIRLQDNDEKNKNDILYYLKEYSSHKSPLHISYDTNNFLIATSLNENNADNSTVPKTLDRYYDEQFTREFGEGARSDFDIARCILEVLCSLFQAPDEQLILNIVSYSTSHTEMALHKTLKRLHNFLRIINGKYHLNHLSVKQWITYTNNQQFRLNINNGHIMNGRYFLSKIVNDSTSIKIVDLCIHVGLSLNTELKEQFLNLKNIKPAILEQSDAEYPVIELAKRIDSVEIMDLLTSLYKNIDRKDVNTMTAAFVACSHGHLESLKALLKKGADITAKTDSFKNIINLDVAIEVSFEYQYWGYGTLDIAAQNGHSHIVEFILFSNGKLFDYPMSRMNSMTLLPIHLACKRGHLEIVKLLSQKFPWMLDWQCLYYASEIGHSDMVEFILNNNVTDECRTCKQHIHWIPKGSVRVQGQVVPSNLSDENFVLFDDWLNITCESALHVAVRRDRSDIVNLLLKQNPDALHCYDRGGRTPMISAVQYGHQDIVDVFLINDVLNYTETCGKSISLNDSFKLHRTEMIQLQDYFCEEGITVLHVAAKFDRISFFKDLKKRHYTINWDIRNSEGCNSIHQAACHSSMNSLFYFELLGIIGQSNECNNGSTPLHSAILCGSIAATELLLKYSNFNEQPLEIKFSYLKLAVSGDLNAGQVQDVHELENNITVIAKMLITEDAILRFKDNMGRNIIHYALSNGHFGVLSYLFSRYFFISHDLLIEKDANRKKPLEFAVDLMSQRREFVINITTAFGFDHENAIERSPEVLSPKEYSLITTLNFLDKFHKMDRNVNTDTLRNIIKKQCVNVMSYILVKSKTVIFEGSTLKDIMKHDRYGLIMLSYYLNFAQKFVDINSSVSSENALKFHYFCRTCDEILNKCHLHHIAQNYFAVSEIISALKLEILHDVILLTLFRKSDVHGMSTCYDKDGFNVLKRAIQSGSPYIVKHLLQLQAESDLEKYKVVEMGLNALKYRKLDDRFVYPRSLENGNHKIHLMRHNEFIRQMSSFNDNSMMFTYEKVLFIKNSLSRSRNESDVHIYQLIKEYRADLPRNKICNVPTTRQFSLVHRLAFEGYTQSLMLIESLWGNEVLKCRTLDAFTPLYMSMFLNFSDTVSFLKKQVFLLEYPRQQAEYYLLSNLLHRFIFSRKDIRCLMDERRIKPDNTYRTIKLYNCLKKVTRNFDFSPTSSGLKQVPMVSLEWLKLLFTLESEISAWLNTVHMIAPGLSFDLYHILKTNIMPLVNWKPSVPFDIIPMRLAKKLILLDLETKTCKYLKRPFYKMFSYLLEDDRTIKHSHFFRTLFSSSLGQTYFPNGHQDVISTFEEIIHNMIHYEWDTENCTEMISAFLYGMKFRAFNECTKKIHLHTMLLRLALYIKSKVESSVFPLGFKLFQPTKRREILNEIHTLFRLYHHYDYINVLFYSKMYRQSIAYKIKGMELNLKYHSGQLKASTFTLFKLNAAKLLERYAHSKAILGKD